MASDLIRWATNQSELYMDDSAALCAALATTIECQNERLEIIEYVVPLQILKRNKSTFTEKSPVEVNMVLKAHRNGIKVLDGECSHNTTEVACSMHKKIASALRTTLTNKQAGSRWRHNYIRQAVVLSIFTSEWQEYIETLLGTCCASDARRIDELRDTHHADITTVLLEAIQIVSSFLREHSHSSTPYAAASANSSRR